MKQFQWTSGSHNGLGGMLGSGHDSRLTSPTQMILEEFEALDANDMLFLYECVQVPDANISKSSMQSGFSSFCK